MQWYSFEGTISPVFLWGLLGSTVRSIFAAARRPRRPRYRYPTTMLTEAHLREGHNYKALQGARKIIRVNGSQIRWLRWLKQLIVYNGAQLRDSLSIYAMVRFSALLMCASVRYPKGNMLYYILMNFNDILLTVNHILYF